MCNVVNKHSICNLANCARYFQSLNHTVSRECVHTLTLKPTDVHTNWSSRTHFASCCKKQAELNVSASADNLTKTAITGDDHVVCVFAHSLPQLHSTHEGADLRSLWLQMWLRLSTLHGLPHLIYILLFQRSHI